MIALQLPQESPVRPAGRGGRGNHPEAGRGDARGQVGRSRVFEVNDRYENDIREVLAPVTGEK